MVTTLEKESATFPEDWRAPFDAGEAYFFDPMHNPYPLTPLTTSVINDASAAGFTTAMAGLNLPIRDMQSRVRNYYAFMRISPAIPANEAEAAQMAADAEAVMQRAVGGMMAIWQGEQLPRIQAINAQIAAMDVAAASSADLLTMLDTLEGLVQEMWTIHFRVAAPMLLSMQLFDELYADLFGGSEADAHALVVGTEMASVRAGLGIAELATSARKLGLDEVLRATPPGDVVDTLRKSEAGQTFLTELRTYLNAFGLRQDLFELATPTWQEDPSFALAAVRNTLISGRDAHAEYAALQASAETALAEATAKLAHYPEAVRQQFAAMLTFARHGAFLQEEHNFYIDQQSTALVRLFFLKVAARLAQQGFLTAPADIFFLTLDEIRALLRGDALPAALLVGQRKQEMETARGLTPPPFIGPPPPGPPPSHSPIDRAMGRFFGGPPQPAQTPGQVRGVAGSRGVATGPARVARTLAEAQALLPGEILVAVTTMPPWTPLFGVAAAVVTETGGPLSHCAIVAREYGIPAVVGAYGATSAIATGQEITVDGGSGVVTLSS